jgi:hypothetical protein
MAQSIYVLSRTEKGQAYEATLDMAAVQEHNKFIVALAPATAHDKVLRRWRPRHARSPVPHRPDQRHQRRPAGLHAEAQIGEVYREFLRAASRSR